MPSYNPCIKNGASGFVFYASLRPRTVTGDFQAGPTLAAGDFKITLDDGAPANLATLPVLDADFTRRIKIVLSQAETNADVISIIAADAAGAEWCSEHWVIHTVVANFDSLSGRIPAALVSGRIDASVGAMAANVVTATAIASGALTAAKFAAGAFDAVWSVAARVLTAGTNIVLAKGTGITGFNDLSAAQVNAEADTALADYDGPTSAELVSEIDAVQADIAALAVPSAASVADAVWDEAIAGHAGTGSTGAALLAAGSAGDPWTTALPGAYGVGSAGKIIGDNIDAAISSHLSSAQAQSAAAAALTAYDPPTKAEMDAGLAGVGDGADPLSNVVPGGYASGTAGAALGRLGSGQVTTVSPVARSGDVVLYRGDDYQAVNGRALEWSDSGSWPSLVGAIIKVHISSVVFTCAYVPGTVQKVQLELTAEQTSIQLASSRTFNIIATLSDGNTVTLVEGRWKWR